jgi:Spy/CpxP family protein refolding chaperone
MKIRTLAGAACAALLLSDPHALRAQADAVPGPGAPSERPGKPFWKKQGKPGGPMTPGLPPEEAQRLAAAREKAKNDPTVRSLKEARDALDQQLEQAVDAAVLAADPGLAPTLEKVKQSRDRAKGMRDRFQSLTPEQRQQLKSAREAAKDDPEVVAAREKMKSADSPEARREAGQAMHEAMKAAMVKQDPSLAGLLERLGPPPGGPGGPRNMDGPRGPMGPPPGMEEGPE